MRCYVITFGRLYNSKQIDFHIEIIVITLFLIASFIDLYRDIKNRQYSTAILIIVAGVVEIVTIIALFYFNFESIDKANINLLWERSKNIRISGLIMILMPSIKSILKSQRFEKKVNS